MDLMFDISGLSEDEETFSTSKKDVLKFLKIIGVGYLVEFSAGVCSDTGNSSIADKVILGYTNQLMFLTQIRDSSTGFNGYVNDINYNIDYSYYLDNFLGYIFLYSQRP